MHLRRARTAPVAVVAEVSFEQNTTTLLMIPSDFVSLAKNFNTKLERENEEN
jgi:hypothetical protein